MADPNTELRKLSVADMCTICRLLNESDCWKRLMAIIPDDENPSELRFTMDDMRIIERAGRTYSNPADIFISEWATMGRRRPTLQTLQNLLIEGKLFKIADYIAINILKCEIPKRPKCGPAAEVDISEELKAIALKEQKASNITENSSDVILSNYTEDSDSLYLRYAENVTELAKQEIKIDVSDLINFSEKECEPLNLTKSTKQSDLIKFSNSKKSEDSSFTCESVFDDIPRCIGSALPSIQHAGPNSDVISSLASCSATGSDTSVLEPTSAFEVPRIIKDVKH